jgi:hypothetical protein
MGAIVTYFGARLGPASVGLVACAEIVRLIGTGFRGTKEKASMSPFTSGDDKSQGTLECGLMAAWVQRSSGSGWAASTAAGEGGRVMPRERI